MARKVMPKAASHVQNTWRSFIFFVNGANFFDPNLYVFPAPVILHLVYCIVHSFLHIRHRTFSYGFISYMDDKIRVPSIAKRCCFCTDEKGTWDSCCFALQNDNRDGEKFWYRLWCTIGDENELDGTFDLRFPEDRRRKRGSEIMRNR